MILNVFRYFSSKQEQCLTTVSEVEIGDFVSSLSGSAAKVRPRTREMSAIELGPHFLPSYLSFVHRRACCRVSSTRTLSTPKWSSSSLNRRPSPPARLTLSFRCPQIIYQKTAIRINRAHLQLNFLYQTFLDSASSSLVVPYAYPSASVSDAILNKVAHPAILSALSSDEAVLVRQHDSHRTK